jgi:hypothetical protein
MLNRPKSDFFASDSEANHGWVEGGLLDALKQASARHHREASLGLSATLLAEPVNGIEQGSRKPLVSFPAFRGNSIMARHGRRRGNAGARR